ncbi:MAG: PAS domain S-box protein [Desulfosarcina sp.]|jgi:PAS domain S-box-containing protein
MDTENPSTLKHALQQAQENEHRFRELAALLPETVYEMDFLGQLIYVNDQGLKKFGYSRADFEAGANALDMIVPADRQRAMQNIARSFSGKHLYHKEYTCLRKDGTTFPGLFYSTFRYRNGKPEGLLGIIIDNSHQAAKKDLEKRVNARTHALSAANKNLRDVILEKNKTERALKQHEAELELKTAKLQDLNTALRFLLKKLEREKTAVEEKIMADLRDLVYPYLKKLINKSQNREINALASIVDNHLKVITSSFSRHLTSPAINLTPAELTVATMVKDGRSTRQIADTLNVAYKTIETHRVNIRRKLGLTRKGANLRTCLMAMEKPLNNI